jgi:hypothetical protein
MVPTKVEGGKVKQLPKADPVVNNDKRNNLRHPIQPLAKDEHGIVRFKDNKIVRYLLDNGGIDLNMIATRGFTREDHEQFAQLIGYSLSGFGDLSYVKDETWESASQMVEKGETEDQARIKVLEEKLATVRKAMKELVPEIFRIHPDDLEE